MKIYKEFLFNLIAIVFVPIFIVGFFLVGLASAFLFEKENENTLSEEEFVNAIKANVITLCTVEELEEALAIKKQETK